MGYIDLFVSPSYRFGILRNRQVQARQNQYKVHEMKASEANVYNS